MQDVSSGVERNRAWPSKRKKNLPAVTKDQNDWFRQAQWATKYWDPKLYMQAMAAVKGTPLLPRDIMTMIMAGRLASIRRNDGRIMYPMAGVADVSAYLDVITQTVGQALRRGEQYWEGYTPGGGGGGMSLIERFEAAGGETSCTFAAIDAGYKDLRLVFNCRGTAAQGDVAIDLRFNNDSGGNYNWRQLFNTTQVSANNDSKVRQFQCSGANAAAGFFSGGQLDIFGYTNGNGFKNAVLHASNWEGATLRSLTGAAIWKSTATIDEIDCIFAAGGFVAGSTIDLYGVG